MLMDRGKAILTVMAFLMLLAIGACSKLCNAGYEGSKCNELATAKFLGRWSAVDTPGNLMYTDTISQGAVPEDIAFSASFAAHHFNHVINASVAAGVITIPYQQPDTGNSFVQGTGSISSDNNHISLTYQIITGLDSPQIITGYAGSWVRIN